MIEHVERHPSIRDRAIFVGDPEDVIPERFGPGLPEIRDWTERHYSFAGYIPGFDPRAIADRAALRAELGYGDEPVCVISVGGRRRRRVAAPCNRGAAAGARAGAGPAALAVAGPRIDPASLPRVEGLEAVGYVHELYRHLAACDVAVVQGGLTTTMELVAAGRPFVSLPLASHFEQQFHVRTGSIATARERSLDFADTSPQQLADMIVGLVGSSPSYRPIDAGGAQRAAA